MRPKRICAWPGESARRDYFSCDQGCQMRRDTLRQRSLGGSYLSTRRGPQRVGKFRVTRCLYLPWTRRSFSRWPWCGVVTISPIDSLCVTCADEYPNELTRAALSYLRVLNPSPCSISVTAVSRVETNSSAVISDGVRQSVACLLAHGFSFLHTLRP